MKFVFLQAGNAAHKCDFASNCLHRLCQCFPQPLWRSEPTWYSVHFNLWQQHIDSNSANNAKYHFNEIGLLQLHSTVQHLKNSSSAVPVFCTVALNWNKDTWTCAHHEHLARGATITVTVGGYKYYCEGSEPKNFWGLYPPYDILGYNSFKETYAENACYLLYTRLYLRYSV